MRAAVRGCARRAVRSVQLRNSAAGEDAKFEAPNHLSSSSSRPLAEQSAYPQPGIAIKDEEPLFGKWGYRPPPKLAQEAYGNRPGGPAGNITFTTQRAQRTPFEPKRVLPPPAKTVAIFGCTGFTGVRLAKRFIEAEEIEEVRLCTRYPDDLSSELKKVIAINPEKCTLEETNALDRVSINRALQGVDTVINAIHLINEDFYNMHYDVNVTGTSNIAYQARMVGCKRYLHVSGLDAQFNNDSDYSDSRSKGEDIAMAESFFTTIVRPGHLYGDGYRFRGLGKVVYPTVYPDTKLQPLWVGDLVEAVFKLLQDPTSVKRVVDLGGPKVMTHMQFAIERAKAYSGPGPIPVPPNLATIAAFAVEYLFPNPWVNQNMICDYEMDQISRTKENNPHIWTFDHLGMEPKTIEEARQLEKSGDGYW